MDNQNQYFSTTSLALAASLITRTHQQPLTINWQASKAEFVFKTNNEFDSLIQLFWKKELPLDCLTYFETLRALKSRLYEERHAG